MKGEGSECEPGVNGAGVGTGQPLLMPTAYAVEEMPRPLLSVRVLAAALCTAFLYTTAAAQGECSASMIPVKTNWVWTYRTTDEKGKTVTYTEQHLPSAQGYTQVTRRTQQEPQRTELQCSSGTYLSTRPPEFGQGIQVTRATFRGTGVPALPWQVGKSWEALWLLEGKRGLLSGSGTLGSRNRVVGRESVTVAAGTFDAWKVEVQSVQQGKVAGLPLSAPPVNYVLWYAEGVGLVKADYGKNGKTELLGLDRS